MALINCHECGSEVSTEAKSCPKCGAKVKTPKKKYSLTAKLLLGLFAIGILAAISSQLAGSDPRADLKGQAKPTLSRMASDCEVEWERAFKKNMKDPGSLDWDHRSAEFGIYEKKTPIVAVPYRAKNGFGALTLNRAICQVNPDTGEVIRTVN